MKTRHKIGIGVVVFCVSLYILGGFQAYRDWGFVCENTGSTKGHREWFFEKKTGYWYKKSALEDFMLEKYPDRLKHRWTSYKGTGKNIFGRAMLRGHGRPGAIGGTEIFLEDWVQKNEPEDILALYELLASDADEEIKKQRVEEISEDYFSAYGD
jgi:hypothetical protein